ncbi:PepSY-associated TM helix domain-containing protein [Flavilitoribacter nigricans]|uniref:Peptidase n=1 Tax=Flavilitoribacter nigricans (strain ATCC 23147 / DSM 23189 / NBRC 102662 / NCIMB 1420 / SS-2) TaxID=1122177 RepID=A0A2D0MWY2_FLAN2|nr:PepSY-associated TM helix domain-containing protein [Flavilitoribacter nigricans]PHN00690.1 peptidase [Flavilitoribacter nigricans DSM 23189 = NBRC 102662]
MKIKSFLGQVHLWIGLVLGILFFIVAFSGALYTWAPEISRIIYHEAVEAREGDLVDISDLKATIDREFPSGDFRTAFYRDRSTAFQVLLYGNGTYYHANLDPYTGELLHIQDMNTGWLNYLKFLHRNLILGPVGRKIVHWVTLLFLVMTITGLVLWWPVNKKDRKNRLRIKWNASPFKLNYDLHNVLGFYATWVVIFCILTGIFWGFEVVRDGLKSLTGEDQIEYEKPLSRPNRSTEGFDQFALLDSLFREMHQQHPDRTLRISNPHQDDEPVRVTLNRSNALVSQVDQYFFDRYSGRPLTGNFQGGLHEKTSPYHKINGLVYDIHFGTILGLPGRLLVFFASLIAASLPITGFLVWRGKRKR